MRYVASAIPYIRFPVILNECEGSLHPICTIFAGASIARPRKHKTRFEQNKKATRYGVALCILFRLDSVDRTGACAAAAVNALTRLDIGSFFLELDSAHRTNLSANTAANAIFCIYFIPP